MGLGFAGMAIIGVQFALTARFKRAAAPFGMDVLYYFHRLVAIAGAGFILVHSGILLVVYPEALGALDPRSAPGYMTAGRLALLSFLILIVTSIWRKQLKIDYQHWRILHALLATVGFILAIAHIEGAGYYTQGRWVQILWIGYSLFWVALIAYVRVLKPWRIRNAPWRVTEVRPERGRVWTLALEPVGHPGLTFQPGQFAWLTLRGSPFSFSEHPFSIASSAERKGRVEFSIKELGDFTRRIKQIQADETAWLEGPYGAFSIDRCSRATGFVFIAGGIGISPIMSMLRTLADRSDSRALHLVYADSRWEDAAFREELELLSQRLDLKVVYVIEHPPRGWAGEHGRINKGMLARVLPPDNGGLHYFLCGPKPFCEVGQAALRGSGVPLVRMHTELFDMV